jgi:putative hemolysin
MQNRPGSYETLWASSPEEVRCAQALRYEVFSQELNASLTGADQQLDIDPFDEYCEHLLTRHVDSGRIVGTYRILSPESAKRCGRLYSEDEFNLESFASIRPQLVEVGRSCVHADFRQGGVILALWKALGAYMHQHQYRWMLGRWWQYCCQSFSYF